MLARRLGPILPYVVLALGVLAGCGGTGSRGPSHDPVRVLPDRWPTTAGTLSTIRTGCDILSEDALPGGEFTVALTAAVDPSHAPVPHNNAERLVFAQLYETLVNVSCDGTAAPGLAASWTCTADSTTWVFSLREDARFWDGTHITTADVQRAWMRNQTELLPGSAISLWNWINARDRSITAVDARRLAIQLPEPQARFPLLLAHPAAAVAIRQPGWNWPVGSGPCRLRATDPAPLPDLICLPNPHHRQAPGWKSLTFRVTPGLDPRDLVATDIDLALARDLATVAFYDEAPGFRTVALPWERLYLLVCPPESNPAGPSRWSEAAHRLHVTRDVTGVAIRPWHDVMFPVGGGGHCPQLSGPITGQDAAPLDSDLAAHRLSGLTIAYPAADPGAVELAGRLSHLAGGGTRIAGLAAADLDLALQWQMAGAFVIAQDQIFPTGCLQLAALLGRTAWLQQAGLGRPDPGPVENLVQARALSAGPSASAGAELARTGIVHPLALSHQWLIVRGELAGLRLDFDGTPLLAGLGRPVVSEVSP